MRKITIAVVMLMMVALLAGCSSSATTSTDDGLETIKRFERAQPVKEYTYASLEQDYRNQIAFKEKWDQVVTLRGKISSLGEVPQNATFYMNSDTKKYYKYYINLGQYGKPHNIIFVFRDVHKEDLLKLKDGDYVTLKGTIFQHNESHVLFVASTVVR